eukprot:g13557.t1
MGSCPEVSLLGRIVVVERICQSLLQNPLSADASDRQEVLLQDVKDMIPNLEANLRIGYLTQLPELIVSHLLEGACGKMIQAERDAGEMHGVLEPSYRWPQPHLADESLKQRGLDCEEAELIQAELLQKTAGDWW